MSDTDNMVLRTLIALDALHKGMGSSGLLTLLGRNLIVAEALSQAGYEQAALRSIREGHAAVLRVDWDAKVFQVWKADDLDYETLRSAVQAYQRQLREAPRDEIRRAQLVMVDVLTRSKKDGHGKKVA